MAPVRQGPEIKSGLGSAKGVRWRGELDSISRQAEAAEADPDNAAVVGEQEVADDDVMKSAPSWLVSTVVHLIILLVLALVNTGAGRGVTEVLLELGFNDQEESPVEFAEFDTDMQELVDESELVDQVAEEMVETVETEIFDTQELAEVEEITPLEIGVGPASIEMAKPMFNGRTGAMKKALLAIFGGTPDTEAAVARGLEWLKRNQKRDGSWSMLGPYNDGAGRENKCAATAMALLAFLGDGHTHQSGKYKEQVAKGIKALVGLQDRSGFLAKQAAGHEKMYAQAQATIALCELYAMTQDSWLRPKAQAALDFAIEAQSPQGGWRYQPKQDSDTSVTGWFLLGLQSGMAAGLEVRTDKVRRIGEYLDTVSHYDGAGYSYQSRGGPSPAMTAEGLLCRQYLGWPRNEPAMIAGVNALLDGHPFDLRDRDVYYWYYATQVLHHFGGSPWREWNSVMREKLPAAQIKTGKESGSWAPQQDVWGRSYGRLYTTCLSIYCLEVYYRHMPLYKHLAE